MSVVSLRKRVLTVRFPASFPLRFPQCSSVFASTSIPQHPSFFDSPTLLLLAPTSIPRRLSLLASTSTPKAPSTSIPQRSSHFALTSNPKRLLFFAPTSSPQRPSFPSPHIVSSTPSPPLPHPGRPRHASEYPLIEVRLAPPRRGSEASLGGAFCVSPRVSFLSDADGAAGDGNRLLRLLVFCLCGANGLGRRGAVGEKNV